MCLVYEGDFAEGKREGREGTEYQAINGQMVQVYEGEWRANKRHGQGRELPHYDSSTGQQILEYKGDWMDGKRHGKGEELTDGKVIYKGGWADGEKNGDGVATGMRWEQNYRYHGPTRDGKAQGEDGELRDGNDRVVYKGDWQDGKREGNGVECAMYRQKEVKVYEGEWRDNKRHGRGTEFHHEDGQLLYEGEWVNGQRTNIGEGRVGFMPLQDDKKKLVGYYHGETQHGVPNGKGELRYGINVVYKGDWQDGKRNGKGVEYAMHSQKMVKAYEGEWRDNIRHGRGTELRHEDGQLIYEGEWANGEKTKRGKGKVGFMELEGDQGQVLGDYHGETQNGQPNGEGEIRDGNNVVYKGGWKNGKQHGQGKAYYGYGGGPMLWFEGEWREGLAHSGTLFPDGHWSAYKNPDGTPYCPITPIRWQDGQKIPDRDLDGYGTKLYEWLQNQGLSGYFPADAF
ncbi:unnamed protein product [Vitrella brassicaformis CCMP3155]|uniref:MORN repeat protein n=1 Tax=Vitrella brassicaformis (strain CCMP3155) TaxID=1169540 RepID=A0A0G4G5G5_VITBC|nr:unnamed protein product [Vitrella brassicaformis CCMP3155]|eukprot:CEM23790.1 unnamed protein product [Vitrella brassicaformis CCMP3155]